MTATRNFILAGLLLAAISACANFDITRAAHDAIQQASCEQSEPRGACNRDWGGDYRAWQAQRAAYLESLESAPQDAHADWLQPVEDAALPEL